jgi:hypothetical protein
MSVAVVDRRATVKVAVPNQSVVLVECVALPAEHRD